MQQLHITPRGLKSLSKALRLPLLCCALVALHSPEASAALAGGTYSINPGGTASATVYKSLTDAISDMTSGTRADGGTPNGAGVTGAVVFELAAGYTSAGETFPLTFTNITGASAGNTITVRPAAGVSTPLLLTSNDFGGTVVLNEANYVVLDGRPGGTGTNKYLEINTTHPNAYAFSFISSASNNIARFCTFRSARPASSTVFFGGAGSGNGNDNNVIDNCNVEVGTTPSAYGILSSGTTGSENSGNVISNCNISNFTTTGLYLAAGNNGWTVADNSFYLTSSIALTSQRTYTGIHVISGGGHNITGNYIGGSQPRCAGTAWTVTGAYNNTFAGIGINTGVASSVNIYGNTIANVSFQSSQTNATTTPAFSGIFVIQGVAVIDNNTIGSETGNGSITFVSTSTGGSPYVYGILSTASINQTIRNNKIGSITATTNITSRGVHINAIKAAFAAGTTSVVSGNKIGSTTTANSIHAATASTNAQGIYGITWSTLHATARMTYADNIIANITNNSANQSALAPSVGIETGASNGLTVKDNYIYNLKSLATPLSPVTGISFVNLTGTGNIISGNKIYTLQGGTTSGLNINSSSTGSGVVEGNLIHSLAPGNSDAFASMTGIINNSNDLALVNNMIRLGIAANGNSILSGFIYGIQVDATNTNAFHNSVYIGGDGVTSSWSTSAFSCKGSGTTNVQNNIFVNARSNGSGAGYHYACMYNAAPTSGVVDNNLLYAPGVGGVIANDGVADYTLSNWQTTHGIDISSVSVDPAFVNATGNADSVDLHLEFGSPAETAITAVSSVTTDYDGESRSSFGNMHIGADASHFNGVKWNGSTSTVWSNNANWDGGVAPTATENALIPAGLTNYPDLNGGSVSITSLLVAKGGRVKITNNGTLQLSGVITNKDTIDAKGGVILLSDASVRNIVAGVLDVNMLALNNSAGVVLKSGKVNVYSTYMPISGQLTTNGNMVLKSTATGTAYIGSSIGGGGNYISGDVTIERYIPGKRAFRFLSHPFSHSIGMSELTDDIDITGTGGAPFTATGTNSPSAFSYNAAMGNNSTTGVNPGWAPFTASSLWNRHQAMRVLVRGAKGEGLNGNTYTPSATTIDMNGAPNQGTITVTLTQGDSTSFVLTGNPFPSAVQMNLVATTGVGTGYMLWDANQGANGGYTSSFFFMPGGVLPAGSAFFTTLTAPTGSLVFEEGDKASTTSSTTFKTTETHHIVELSLQDSTIFYDRLLLNFDSSATATVGNLDMVKFYNPDMTFYTLSKDDSMLSIDSRPFTDKEVIKLGLYSTINNNFKITVPQYSTPAGTKVYLKDNYLNKTQEITGVGYTYWFATSADKKSWGNDRFELFTEVTLVGIIEAQPASNLKVKLAPNPATNDVNIYCEGINGKTATVSIVNMMGVQVAAGSTSTGHLNVPMQQIPAGMYMVTIQCGTQTITQKLIKK